MPTEKVSQKDFLHAASNGLSALTSLFTASSFKILCENIEEDDWMVAIGKWYYVNLFSLQVVSMH